MTSCLLIDENGRSRQHLEKMLAGLGLRTFLTSGTEEAVRFCNDNSPEVVMVSAMAGGGMTRDFVKRLRLSGRGRPPVVFLYAEKPDTTMFGQTILEGAADVLMLPFDRDLLHFKLRQAGVAV
jgi:PleD family two-component response regulator